MSASHETHEASARFYWMIGAILAVITAVEVGITYIDMPQALLVALLLVLSVAKGAQVVMFFMHLKGDAQVFKLLFITPFILAVILILLFMGLFSGHVGIAG